MVTTQELADLDAEILQFIKWQIEDRLVEKKMSWCGYLIYKKYPDKYTELQQLGKGHENYDNLLTALANTILGNGI